MRSFGRHMAAAVLSAALAVSVAFSLTAYAGSWKEDGRGRWYAHDDGTYTSSDWEQIDGSWYCFDGEGYLLTNTTTPDGYQVGADGKWITGETAQSGEQNTTAKVQNSGSSTPVSAGEPTREELFLRFMKKNFAEQFDYAYYDVGRNGVPLLFIEKNGYGEYEVYDVKDGQVVLVGELNGASDGLYGFNGKGVVVLEDDGDYACLRMYDYSENGFTGGRTVADTSMSYEQFRGVKNSFLHIKMKTMKEQTEKLDH